MAMGNLEQEEENKLSVFFILHILLKNECFRPTNVVKRQESCIKKTEEANLQPSGPHNFLFHMISSNNLFSDGQLKT